MKKIEKFNIEQMFVMGRGYIFPYKIRVYKSLSIYKSYEKLVKNY